VIEKAKTACKTAGYDVADHFLDIRKMVTLGSGAKRNIDDMRTEDGIIVQHVKNNRDG
jgi:DNA-damage-inducible protein D